MKIVSQFQDYYDSCRGYGFDPKLIYVRKTEEIDISWNEHKEVKEQELLKAIAPLTTLHSSMPSLGKYHHKNTGIISFCGRAHPFYLFEGKAYYYISLLMKAVEESNNIDREEYLASLRNQKSHSRWRWGHHYGSLDPTSWATFCEESDFNIPDTLHMYLKSPVVLTLDDEIIVNPRLKDYSFATQVDPYTAFQELSMYIGNNLASQMDPEVNIPDKLRAESKGFDDWSFRRHKDESKKPRRK